jgi:septal ring factor EnvC (AmiA/AmiB activator)
MVHQFMSFLWMVFSKWQGYVTGGGITALLVVGERLAGKTLPKKVFVAIFVLSFLLVSMFVAWREEYTSAEWRGGEVSRLSAVSQAQQNQVQQLQSELAQKERPIILQQQPNPEISKLISLQEQEISKMQDKLPSPKKRAYQVSNEILKFLEERTKAQPKPTRSEVTTQRDWNKQVNQIESAYETWANETSSQFRLRFTIPIAGVLEDVRQTGREPGGLNALCNAMNGNLFAIRECASGIGNIAPSLPD